MFNYQNLESGQFEVLCRDIMQVKIGRQLHVFARGRDGGVDLTDDSNEHNIVVQVKHYEKSGFTALKSNLENEIEKVRKLDPEQYYVCVSQSLTDSNVNTIYQMFSEYMKSTDNILTLDDIDSFLHNPENIQITRNHTKLWLESGTMLQLLLECFPKLGIYSSGAMQDKSLDEIIELPSIISDYATSNLEIENLLKRAKEGNTNAQYQLGSIYSTGSNGTAKDYDEALFWYLKAAESGHAFAMFYLACMYKRGQGVKENPEKAFYWFEKSAEAGNEYAISNVGACYKKGYYVKKDCVKAAEWYKKGEHSSTCSIALGELYELGDGVEKDLKKALHYYEKAEVLGGVGSAPIKAIERVERKIRYMEKNKNQVKKITEQEADKENIDKVLKDVTGYYNNKCILIYSLAAKRFASARLDIEDVPVCCSTNNQDAWEKFQIVVDKEGWASFKAINGYYLTVRLDKQSNLPPINASAPKSLLWEQFKIYKIENKFAIFARCNGQWVTSRIDWDGNPLYASRTVADSWEMFDIRIVM